MKLIESSVEILPQGEGLDGIYKQIEIAGRTCYKSEDKITADSAKEFVDRMIKSGHGAMLEHGTVYLTCPNGWHDYWSNPYSRMTVKNGIAYITTNLRVLVEHQWLEDLQYVCEPTEYHARRITAKFICDRGVSHEFVRHRVFSFAQESQRFCNYSKGKFDNEVTFIIPSQVTTTPPYKEKNGPTTADILWSDSCFRAEGDYLRLLKLGWKPQEARSVLPNATKTELVITGFTDDWQHFFDLRCAKNAHPDAQKLANELKALMDGSKE